MKVTSVSVVNGDFFDQLTTEISGDHPIKGSDSWNSIRLQIQRLLDVKVLSHEHWLVVSTYPIYGIYTVNIYIYIYMVIIWLMMVNDNLVGGFNQPLWKIWVNGKDDIPYMKWKIIHLCLKPPTRTTRSDIQPEIAENPHRKSSQHPACKSQFPPWRTFFKTSPVNLLLGQHPRIFGLHIPNITRNSSVHGIHMDLWIT